MPDAPCHGVRTSTNQCRYYLCQETAPSSYADSPSRKLRLTHACTTLYSHTCCEPSGTELMILPQTYEWVLALMILSLICLGSWASTFKLAGKWRFELFY